MLLKKLFAKKASTAAEGAKAARPNSALADDLAMPEAAKDEFFNAQPSHIQQILTVLHRIARDALLVGDIMRRGAPLPDVAGEVGTVPIYCRDIEGLFETLTADGSKRFQSYYYTNDLATMDPRAQLHLSQFFGRVMALNTLLTTTDPSLRAAQAKAVPKMLDRILLEALCFKGLFSGFAVTRALLTRAAPDSQMVAQFEALVARTKADLAATSPYLHDSATAFETLPMVNQSLIVELSKRYEEGQIAVNGVYFDAATGAQMVGGVQRLQA
ncbi:hypothetical protein [Pseudorhodobacter ferrugineus]|uniref:hypothetical protein n=1 Tax=Pseudorhodobacter ferrugineus TaxID=77008 RepID=UPI00042710D5|nr:hypothetical protein [Pseudorhodobacter ferrugineus]